MQAERFGRKKALSAASECLCALPKPFEQFGTAPPPPSRNSLQSTRAEHLPRIRRRPSARLATVERCELAICWRLNEGREAKSRKGVDATNPRMNWIGIGRTWSGWERWSSGYARETASWSHCPSRRALPRSFLEHCNWRESVAGGHLYGWVLLLGCGEAERAMPAEAKEYLENI